MVGANGLNLALGVTLIDGGLGFPGLGALGAALAGVVVRLGLAVALVAVIIVAAILFGALFQGGSQLSFDMPHVSRDMVIVIQGLVILFCGALENLFRVPLAALFERLSNGKGRA